MLFTATDAYVRHYQLIIPSDCVVSRSRREQAFTEYFFKSVLKARVCRDASLRIPSLVGG
jgi:nicotinamidase-related amidase